MFLSFGERRKIHRTTIFTQIFLTLCPLSYCCHSVVVATAVGLVRNGIANIAVYEKASKLRPVGAAIGLFPNGLEALEAISPNIAKRCIENSIQHKTTKMYDSATGGLVREMNNTGPNNPTYLVWYLLQQYLAEELDTLTAASNNDRRSPTIVQLGRIVESYEVDGDGVVSVTTKSRLDNDNNSKDSASNIATCRILVGADGIHSTIRSYMFPQTTVTKNYHGKLMFRAVMNMNLLDAGTLPNGAGAIAFQGNIKGKLFAIRETAKDIVTFTSMAVFDIDADSDKEGTKKKDPDSFLMPTPALRKKRLQELFHEYPKTVQHVLDRVPAENIYENVVYDIDILQQWSLGPVVLIGDAAHAMTPGLGQGANQGLEDACELVHSIATSLVSSSTTAEDATARTTNTDVTSKTAIPQVLENFYCLRFDRVNDIHTSSRAMTHQVNQSDKNKKLFERMRDPSFTNNLYTWKPSFLVETS